MEREEIHGLVSGIREDLSKGSKTLVSVLHYKKAGSLKQKLLRCALPTVFERLFHSLFQGI